MDRRQFLQYTAAGAAAFALGGPFHPAEARRRRKGENYSVIILGDTHFDTEPDTVYHSLYNEPTEWLNRVQRAEFARNGEMWRERCPRLVKRAACLAGDDTRMVLQMGDLVQGDCGDAAVHTKMLDDVMNRFKADFGGLPFVSVVGNHDIRGVGAEQAYYDYMPARMGRELGKDIRKTTFDFAIGDDAFLVLDFNRPDDDETERILKDTEGARHTFVIVHGPLFPFDGGSCRWFYHGGAGKEDTEARRHFRAAFARRGAIALCGHTHRTEFADWWGDGGRITQMTMNSVWSKEKLSQYVIDAQGAAEYGILRMRSKALDNGSPVEEEAELFEEYRPGLRAYTHSPAAGSYKLNVSDKDVTIDFYGGDATFRTWQFVLR